MGFLTFGEELPTSPFPETFEDFPTDQEDWGCATWVTYHERNRAIMGTQKANEMVILEWDKLSRFSSIFKCRFSCAFQDYFEGVGVSVRDLIGGLICSTEEVFENVTKGAVGTTQLIKFITNPLVLGTGLAIFGFFKFTKKGKAILKKGI